MGSVCIFGSAVVGEAVNEQYMHLNSPKGIPAAPGLCGRTYVRTYASANGCGHDGARAACVCVLG